MIGRAALEAKAAALLEQPPGIVFEDDVAPLSGELTISSASLSELCLRPEELLRHGSADQSSRARLSALTN